MSNNYTNKQLANARALSPDTERRLIFSSLKTGQAEARKIEFLDRVFVHAAGRRDAIAQALMLVKRLADLQIIGPKSHIDLQGAAVQDVTGENDIFETNAAHRVPAQIMVNGRFLWQVTTATSAPLKDAFLTRALDLFRKTDVVPKVVNSVDSILDWAELGEGLKPQPKSKGKVKITRANNRGRGLDRFLSLVYDVARGVDSLDGAYLEYMTREAELLNVVCMRAQGDDDPGSTFMTRVMTGYREQDLRSDIPKADFRKMAEKDERMYRNEMNAQKLAILEMYVDAYGNQSPTLTASDYWRKIATEQWI